MKTYIDKNTYKYIFFLLSLFLVFGCTKDLDDIDTNNINANNAFQDAEDYLAFLGKLYGGLSLTGQQGPAGQGDLIGFDEGASNYARNYWNMNEFTADALKWRFSDSGFRELHENTWTPDNDVISVMYNRIIFQVTQVNEFIRQVQGIEDPEINTFRAEARFLRALSYYHGLELYGGNIPFVTEENLPGAFLPEQTNGADLFAYIESELLAIENELLDPGQPQFYGRADRGAAWMLLAKLYLNAEAFIGQDRYADCIQFCENILSAGYQLDAEYGALFRADNNLANGIIFPITHDGIQTQSFGLGFILTNGTISSDISVELGITGNAQAFAAVSCREEFTRLYEYPNDDPFEDSPDGRADFMYKTDHSVEVPVPPVGSAFTDGFAYTKYRNMLSDGSPGQDDRQPDMDFPLFRLADVYLMYAEAFLRGGGGSEATALDLVNQVRQRAYGDNSGDITSIDLQFILDERGRELSWEGQRRTDLVRFGQYTGSTYLWDWKGGAPQGTAIDDFRNIFPLPSSDLAANPNLEQNPGY